VSTAERAARQTHAPNESITTRSSISALRSPRWARHQRPATGCRLSAYVECRDPGILRSLAGLPLPSQPIARLASTSGVSRATFPFARGQPQRVRGAPRMAGWYARFSRLHARRGVYLWLARSAGQHGWPSRRSPTAPTQHHVRSAWCGVAEATMNCPTGHQRRDESHARRFALC
jgi:hypothetical protein